MNHSAAQGLMIEGHAITREITEYCFNISRKRQLDTIINELNDIKRRLFESGEIKLLNHLYRYGLSVLNPDGMKITEKQRPKLLKKDAVLLFRNIAVYPVQIIRFLGDDQVFNNILINSALKSGTLNDIDHRDSRPWEDVALRLARIGDSFNWSYLLKESSVDGHGHQIPNIISTLDEFKDFDINDIESIKNSIKIYHEYCIKQKKYASETPNVEKIFDGIIRHAGEELATEFLSLSRISALQNKDFMFKVYDEYKLELDKSILKQNIYTIFYSGGLAGSGYSLLWVCAIHHPEIILESVDALIKSKSSHAHHLANIIKQLNQKISVNGKTYEAPGFLINDLASMTIKSLAGDKIRDVTNFLEDKCGLSKEQYIGLNEFAPFRRQMISNDMEI